MFGRARRLRARKSVKSGPRVLRIEHLEPRSMLSAAPLLAQPITVSGGTSVGGTTAAVSILGSDQAGASKLVYDWTVTGAPTGGAATFSQNMNNAAANTVLSFNKAGTYNVSCKIVDPSNLSITASQTITVAQTETALKLSTTAGGSALSLTAPLSVSATSQTLAAQAVDQFGNAMTTQPTFKWLTPSIVSGGATPGLTSSAGTATITFAKAGTYSESVQAVPQTGATITDTLSMNVVEKPTYLTITPVSTASQATGTSAQFTTQVQDQFHASLSEASTLTWAQATMPAGASAPKFSTSGSTTTVAFNDAGSYSLTATDKDASGNSCTELVTVSVAQTATSLSAATSSFAVTSGSLQLNVPTALDQFGNALLTNPTFSFSSTTTPSGATAPSFTSSGGVEQVNFTSAGTYTFTAKDSATPSLTKTFTAVVSSGFSSVVLSTSPGGTALNLTSPLAVSGATQALYAVAVDQFGKPLATQPTFTWAAPSATSGTTPTLTSNAGSATLSFTSAGTFTESVTAKPASGSSITDKLTISVGEKPAAMKVSETQNSPTTAQLSVSGLLDQFGKALTESTTVTWSATTLPSGAAAPTFTTAASGTTTATFKAAGTYVLTATDTDANHNSIAASVTITIASVATTMAKPTTTALNVTTASAALSAPTVYDQFGNAMSASFTWTTTAAPSGAKAPTISVTAGTTNVTFSAAGSYTLSGSVAGNQSLSLSLTAKVAATLTSVVVTPGAASVNEGGMQQFSATASDQFGAALATQPSFSYTATGTGSITTAGLYTAGSTTGTAKITALASGIVGSTTITVQAPAPSGTLQNAFLQNLLTTMQQSGSFTRADMIQILQAVANQGAVTASEMSDLKTILSEAATLNMPNYVQVLGSDVVNGDAANATYLGKSLGNLAAGSSATQLTDLIDKWFYGTDLPTLTSSSYSYAIASGSVFPTTPSHANEYQGELGDCYFISTLGTIADKDPAAIEDMITNNGDGTFTVRFYTGTYGDSGQNADGSYSDGFTSGTGKADYVTVNLDLPTYYGEFIYADYGQSVSSANNSLWIPLIEKAYAQWNQTGNEGRDGTNTYNSIQGGWMSTVDAQVLGHNGSDYGMSSSTALINAIASGDAVTIGTDNIADGTDGLYGDHAYAVTGYNATTNTFTLYNPWGFDQPGQLTWSELVATCDAFCTVNAAGATPMSSSVLTLGSSSKAFSLDPSSVSAETSAAPAAPAADSGPASAMALSAATEVASDGSNSAAVGTSQPVSVGGLSIGSRAGTALDDGLIGTNTSPLVATPSPALTTSLPSLSDPSSQATSAADAYFAQLGEA